MRHILTVNRLLLLRALTHCTTSCDLCSIYRCGPSLFPTDPHGLTSRQISVSGGVHFDLVKRIMRDIQRTGQEPQEALQQITETVFPMYKVRPI